MVGLSRRVLGGAMFSWFWPLKSDAAPVPVISLNRPLRYLIGIDDPVGVGNEITMVGYDVTRPVKDGLSFAYCNLFDEKNTGKYGPYIKGPGTAKDYKEGWINPQGAGWAKNLHAQFKRRKAQGFTYIELDNPDSYKMIHVIGAIELANSYGLKVIAKNPNLCEPSYVGKYLRMCHGAIVERDETAEPHVLHALRTAASVPDYPVWFVGYGDGLPWIRGVAAEIHHFKNMYASYSRGGEYINSVQM